MIRPMPEATERDAPSWHCRALLARRRNEDRGGAARAPDDARAAAEDATRLLGGTGELDAMIEWAEPLLVDPSSDVLATWADGVVKAEGRLRRRSLGAAIMSRDMAVVRTHGRFGPGPGNRKTSRS